MASGQAKGDFKRHRKTGRPALQHPADSSETDSTPTSQQAPMIFFDLHMGSTKDMDIYGESERLIHRF
jgi:hypothetical protein